VLIANLCVQRTPTSLKPAAGDVLEVWSNMSLAAEAMKKGLDVILSDGW
jgi:hypothetical protein